jgi:hypothetical protein
MPIISRAFGEAATRPRPTGTPWPVHEAGLSGPLRGSDRTPPDPTRSARNQVIGRVLGRQGNRDSRSKAGALLVDVH